MLVRTSFRNSWASRNLGSRRWIATYWGPQTLATLRRHARAPRTLSCPRPSMDERRGCAAARVDASSHSRPLTASAPPNTIARRSDTVGDTAREVAALPPHRCGASLGNSCLCASLHNACCASFALKLEEVMEDAMPSSPLRRRGAHEVSTDIQRTVKPRSGAQRSRTSRAPSCNPEKIWAKFALWNSASRVARDLKTFSDVKDQLNWVRRGRRRTCCFYNCTSKWTC